MSVVVSCMRAVKILYPSVVIRSYCTGSLFFMSAVTGYDIEAMWSDAPFSDDADTLSLGGDDDTCDLRATPPPVRRSYPSPAQRRRRILRRHSSSGQSVTSVGGDW